MVNKNELQIETESLEDEVTQVYDIATYPSDFTLTGIVDMLNDKDIMIPDFQREFIWNIRQSSLLIDSFLMGLPVPPVFFYIDEENRNIVIDGQQRILSVAFFFEGFFGAETKQGKRKVFRLAGLDKNSPYFNKRFNDLDDTDQRKLRNAVLRAVNIRQLGPSEDAENTSMYHIFERLNTGGTPLKSQEIRNCVFRGEIVQALRKLNEDKYWRQILGKPDSDKHQRDIELILRIFALYGRHNKYEKPMKEFMNKAMKANRKADSKRFKSFAKLFPRVTQLIVKKLGEKPFHLKGPLNASALDSVFCTILNNVESLPNNLQKRFSKLKADDGFDLSTYESTSDKKVLQKRFSYAKSFLID